MAKIEKNKSIINGENLILKAFFISGGKDKYIADSTNMPPYELRYKDIILKKFENLYLNMMRKVEYDLVLFNSQKKIWKTLKELKLKVKEGNVVLVSYKDEEVTKKIKSKQLRISNWLASGEWLFYKPDLEWEEWLKRMNKVDE